MLCSTNLVLTCFSWFGFPAYLCGVSPPPTWPAISIRKPSISGTPWKINMEPENTPLEEENHLPNHHFSGSMFIFRGVPETFGDLFTDQNNPLTTEGMWTWLAYLGVYQSGTCCVFFTTLLLLNDNLHDWKWFNFKFCILHDFWFKACPCLFIQQKTHPCSTHTSRH